MAVGLDLVGGYLLLMERVSALFLPVSRSRFLTGRGGESMSIGV